MVEPVKCKCGKTPKYQTNLVRLQTVHSESVMRWYYSCSCGVTARDGTSPQDAATNWNEERALTES